MAWIYLLLAGLFEIGWPLGLKIAQKPEHKLGGFALAGVCLLASGVLLWLAQKTIPMGTAYAVWTGIGAAGAFTVGVCLYGDPLTALRVVSVLLIIAGVVGLKLAHSTL
jgi:quaternary ammonium compound-resistance protein SugE